jgi:hypothetical protein
VYTLSLHDALPIFLTEAEAVELKDELERIITEKIKKNHGHIPSDDYSSELTIAIYNSVDGLIDFSEEIRNIIGNVGSVS